jgi:hypothetical protein
MLAHYSHGFLHIHLVLGLVFLGVSRKHCLAERADARFVLAETAGVAQVHIKILHSYHTSFPGEIKENGNFGFFGLSLLSAFPA